MRPKSSKPKASAERVVKDIRRATRRHFSAEDKIRIVLEGLRGDDSIAELCRKEGIAQSLYYTWLEAKLAAGGGPYGGGDGLGGYAPLAVAVPDTFGAVQQNWVHGSHLGVPLITSDAAGNVIPPSGDYLLPGFPGQSRVFADLYYNRYRDYDPVTGRYIQADPIGLGGGSNSYVYVGGNPVNAIDPDGLEKVDLFGPGAGSFHDGVRHERDIPGVCQVYGHMSPRGIEVWRNGRKVLLRDPVDINRELMRRGCKPKQPVFFLGCRAGEGDDPIAKQYADRYRVRTVGSTQYTWWGSGGYGGTFGKNSAGGKDRGNPGQWRPFGP